MQMKFFDDNTRSWWMPITGGANVPALNDLLAPHNISLGERILQGVVTLGDHKVTVSQPASQSSSQAVKQSSSQPPQQAAGYTARRCTHDKTTGGASLAGQAAATAHLSCVLAHFLFLDNLEPLLPLLRVALSDPPLPLHHTPIPPAACRCHMAPTSPSSQQVATCM